MILELNIIIALTSEPNSRDYIVSLMGLRMMSDVDQDTQLFNPRLYFCFSFQAARGSHVQIMCE